MMLHYLTDQAREAIADKRAEIATARGKVDAFASTEINTAEARLAGLQERQNGLGGPPAIEAFVTATDWRQATDQHTFDSRDYAREVAAAFQKLNAKREEHSAMLALVVTLKQELRGMLLAALDVATVLRTREAAEIAHVRQSFLNRIPREQWHTVVSMTNPGPPPYQVQSSGYADMSFFQARVPGDGFGPDKSAAMVAELDLF